VYHATCHAEAVVSTNSLAARLRTELATQSRPDTPEAKSLSALVSRSTPPPRIATPSTLRLELRKSKSRSPGRSLSPSPESKLVGTKRKIEHDAMLNGETDHTPPLKKSALSLPVA
jgi:pre-mRNA cleavage complex 2 protein Pcf11